MAKSEPKSDTSAFGELQRAYDEERAAMAARTKAAEVCQKRIDAAKAAYEKEEADAKAELQAANDLHADADAKLVTLQDGLNALLNNRQSNPRVTVSK